MNTPEHGCVVSDEAQGLIDMALNRANLRNAPITTNHLLQVIISGESVARSYLLEQRVEPTQLASLIDEKAPEPPLVLEMVWRTAVSMSSVVTSLHLLSGLLRYHADSRAIETLRRAGHDTTRLRNTLISQLMMQPAAVDEPPVEAPRQEPPAPVRAAVETLTPSSPAAIQQNRAEAPNPYPTGPMSRPQPPQGAGPAQGVDPRQAGLAPDHPLSTPNPYLPSSPAPPAGYNMGRPGPGPGVGPVSGQWPARRRDSRPTPARRPTKPTPRRRKPTTPTKEDRTKLASRMRGRFGARKPHRDLDALPTPSMEGLAREIFDQNDVPLGEMKRQVEEDIKKFGMDLNAHGEAKKKKELPVDRIEPGRSPGAEKAAPSARTSETLPAVKIRAARGPASRSPERQKLLEERYTLDEEDYPFLDQLGRNLSMLAVQGRIDTLVGRDAEIVQLTDILNKRRSNNPLLVGSPGVGKTAIVEGLAMELANETSGSLSEKIIIELEMGRLLSGTQLRGSFSERLIGLKDEVAKAEGRVVIFLDEIHTWIGAGSSGDGGADAAGELKAALARGQFPCIGATTTEEYTRFIETDPAFRRRFQMVEVNEPNTEECLTILKRIIPTYESHHGVSYKTEALEAAIVFSKRYIPEQRLPDKAISLLDLSGSRARRQDKSAVDRSVVAQVLSEQTGVPLDKLLMRDRERFLRMEESLGTGLIGHRQVVEKVSEVIRRNYAGFHSGRPIGSFLFLGPTGVGKTELVKVLADFLFRDRAALVRLDMSEYRESHAVARLIGAPPGYVGYEQGGQLTEAVRKKPYQIVLLDEVEKAHHDVLNVLLQLLDDGRLTDGRGRTVDFSNTVVIMTSNLGSEYLSTGLKEVTKVAIGFGHQETITTQGELRLTEEVAQSVIGVARSSLSPELWNRIEERLVFGPLSREEVARIARLQLMDSSRRLATERDIYIEADEAVYSYLIDNGGYDPQLGARPMRQTLQRLVEAPVSELILVGKANPGDRLLVSVCPDRGGLIFTVMDN